MIDELHAKVDAFFQAAREAQPAAFNCRAGCADCCQVDLSVFPVEAEPMVTAFQALPGEVRAAAATRAHAGKHCALLDPEERRCVIYEDRPLICRTQGLAHLVDDEISHCVLNYAEELPHPSQLLALDRVNAPLVVMDRLLGGDGSRIRLADIARS